MPGASDRVEALFAGPLPAIYNLLRAGEQDHIAIEVITHLDDRTVRGVALTPTQGVAREEAIRDTGHVLRVPVGNRVLGRIFNVFGKTLDRREPVTGGEWRSIHQKPIALRQQSTAEEVLETGRPARRRWRSTRSSTSARPVWSVSTAPLVSAMLRLHASLPTCASMARSQTQLSWWPWAKTRPVSNTTNLISITDGQIYLSPDLFQRGVLPDIDVGRSVSRVGGKTQLPAYRTVAGDLRLAYTQFEELEAFARFGTRLDDETQQTLERGRRVRAVLQQPQYQPIPAREQIAVLLAVTEGIFDELPVEQIRTAETAVREEVTRTQPDICRHIAQGRPLSDSDRADLLRSARQAIESAGLTQETSSQ